MSPSVEYTFQVPLTLRQRVYIYLEMRPRNVDTRHLPDIDGGRKSNKNVFCLHCNAAHISAFPRALWTSSHSNFRNAPSFKILNNKNRKTRALPTTFRVLYTHFYYRMSTIETSLISYFFFFVFP